MPLIWKGCWRQDRSFWQMIFLRLPQMIYFGANHPHFVHFTVKTADKNQDDQGEMCALRATEELESFSVSFLTS